MRGRASGVEEAYYFCQHLLDQRGLIDLHERLFEIRRLAEALQCAIRIRVEGHG
jgi:hypothetical protein